MTSYQPGNPWARMTNQVTPEQEGQLTADAIKSLQAVSAKDLRDQTAALAAAQSALLQAAQARNLNLPSDRLAELARQLAARLGGLGFLNELIYERRDLSEIACNPDGTVWILKKGAPAFERHPHEPGLDEVWMAVQALCTPLGRSFSEATPTVDARLPRDPARNFSGARLKLIHPVLAPGPKQVVGGTGYPALNIRLYEEKPVKPEQIIAWQMAPEAVVRGLVDIVSTTARIIVVGGTASGKTTLLAALCAGIPREARIVKIEDPEEVYLDAAEHPNLVTLEARYAPPGAGVPDYTVTNGVDDAMRMSPRWLIVGEVRKGDAAMALFRAQMSDHPGLTTFHAESPERAVHRLGIILRADLKVDREATKEVFVEAVDVLVQVGLRDTPAGRRRLILGAWEVEPELRGGNVRFRALYQPGMDRLEKFTRRG